jgi:hypothetical protein
MDQKLECDVRMALLYITGASSSLQVLALASATHLSHQRSPSLDSPSPYWHLRHLPNLES